MRRFNLAKSGDGRFGERLSLGVLMIATVLFAGGLIYEGTVLKPPQRTAQLAFPNPNPN